MKNSAEEKMGRAIFVTGLALGAMLLVVALLVTAAVKQARAHSDIDHLGKANHFDNWCCNGEDCQRTEDEDLEDLPGGHVRHLPSGKVFGPPPTRILPSQNSRQYVCIYNGEPRCVYRRFGT
jgi:hypothetical protein